MTHDDREQECENPGEAPTLSTLRIENIFLIERAGKAEARCKRLTRERDELRGPIRFILQRNRDILGGLCDDAIDGIEVQSEELTDALTKLREWLSNTEKETG